jgi:hypothetical protein
MYSKPIQIELIKRPLASSQQITFPHHSEAEKVVPSIKSALWPNKGPHKKIQSLSFLEPEAKPAPVQSYSFCLRFLQNKRMFSIIIFKRKNKARVLLFLVTGSEASLPPQSVSSSNTAGHWPRCPSTAQAWRPSPMALASPSRLAPRLALPPARPASQLTVPGAAARPPRRCSYHRLAVLVLWEGRTTSAWRARLLLGGFSDAGVSESDDDDDEEEDALRAGGPGAYVLGLGQAMVRASSSPSFRCLL